ncbi:hypothetical protein QA596_05525 [Balneolales bacterium ANBcel1]|nr:hypothetical protein [Balneolales bacterium ANBcel1]
MVTEKTIKQLIDKNGEPKITITLPTHKVGSDRQQNPIRFKNLLAKAGEALTAKGLKDHNVDDFLKPAKALLGESLYWSEMGHGMAIYITADHFEVFKLPYEADEMVYIQDHFLVTPLLPMVSTAGSFVILAISLERTRLLRCTRSAVEDITPEDIPAAINDWLEEKPEQQIQFHTGSNDGDSAVYFGHGNTGEEHKEIVEEYLKDVHKSVAPVIKKLRDPLILSGLQKNVGLYRKTEQHIRKLDQIIDHNPDDLSDAQLRDKGWEIIREHFLNNLYDSLEKYRNSASDRVSNDPSEIIPAAVMGKAGAIFIAKNAIKWGKYDEETHKVLYRNKPGDGDVELMNWLSIKGLETGSNVYVLPRQDMPVSADVAALFRY